MKFKTIKDLEPKYIINDRATIRGLLVDLGNFPARYINFDFEELDEVTKNKIVHYVDNFHYYVSNGKVIIAPYSAEYVRFATMLARGVTKYWNRYLDELWPSYVTSDILIDEHYNDINLYGDISATERMEQGKFIVFNETNINGETHKNVVLNVLKNRLHKGLFTIILTERDSEGLRKYVGNGLYSFIEELKETKCVEEN